MMILHQRNSYIKARFKPCKKCKYIHVNKKKCGKTRSKHSYRRAMAHTRKSLDEGLAAIKWDKIK